MSFKDDIIALINSAYRHDEFINDFTGAVSTVFNRIYETCESIRNNTFFDSLDMNGVLWWEKHLKITPTDNDLIYRRSKIEAKWKSSRHNGVKLIQDTCDAWRNGQVKVDFCRAILLYPPCKFTRIMLNYSCRIALDPAFYIREKLSSKPRRGSYGKAHNRIDRR